MPTDDAFPSATTVSAVFAHDPRFDLVATAAAVIRARDVVEQARHARQEGAANMEFTVGKRDAARTMELVNDAKAAIGFQDISIDDNVAKVSVIGVGMRSHTGVAQTMFKALAEKGVNIQVISTSEIKISVLIDAAYTELAVRALHAAYGLDQV